MANVTVSALRMSSMLTNRNRTVSDMANALSLSIHPSKLIAEDTQLQFDDLVALGKYFKRPWSYFLIDEVEAFGLGHDNRTIGNQARPPSPEMFDEFAAVTEMLSAAAELFPETKFQIPSTRITTDSRVEAAGASIREFLEVTDEQQLGVRDEFASLRLWAEALQSRGVYVSQRRLRDETIRAFSRVEGEQAVVVVDTGDTAYARTFSLIHEYCHVILRSTGMCDLDDHSLVERHCNAVTAAVLMPPSLIVSLCAGWSFGTGDESDDALLMALSREFGVSQAAVLIRLRESGVIDQAQFSELEHRRAARRSEAAKSTGGTFYPPRINRVGRRYARNVFGALDGGLINRQDASALLEIGEHLVSTYREELDSSARHSR